MFFKLLDRLRNWPESKRQLAAMVFSGVVMAGIFTVWVSSFIYSAPTAPDSPEQVASSIQVTDAAKGGEVGSPWATLMGAFGDFLNLIGNSVTNLKTNFSKFEVVNSAAIPTASSSSVATSSP